ncbi:MAG: DUF2934 domain-containing protein [Alphaproteobacteria bacterium]|nr:DUF2934 domain-containing protein [Alphaproteobacteria bacterium]
MAMAIGLNKINIAARAYQIWESEGRPEGQDFNHWLRAEAELSAALSPPVITGNPPYQKLGARQRRSKER